LCLQQPGQSCPHDGMVIHDKDARGTMGCSLHTALPQGSMFGWGIVPPSGARRGAARENRIGNSLASA
jgi:hypothetical protein